MTTMFGLRARLILEDDQGEFEVVDALRISPEVHPGATIDPQRVADAIELRKRALRSGRPAY